MRCFVFLEDKNCLTLILYPDKNSYSIQGMRGFLNSKLISRFRI